MKTLLKLLAIVMTIVMTGCELDGTIPTVKTGAINNLTITSVMISGEITSDGGDAVFAKGICWSTNQLPNLSDNKVALSGADPAFSAQLTGLKPGVNYYARAYAANTIGTGFGETVSFTTLGGLPIISNPGVTTSISAAALTATVNPNGLETRVTFEYGTSAGALIRSIAADPNLISGTGEVAVKADLNNLDPSATYYFRIKADNGVGTGVSAILDFKPYSVQDVDGNLYHSVKIGDQAWLMENLKTTHYANGSPIANVTDPVAWFNLTTGAYCWYNNDPKIGEVYGALYNWYVGADSRGLIEGWHTPTFEEWLELQTFLGGFLPAGPKIMETGSAHWKTLKVPATNSSGFTALPNGGLAINYSTNISGFMELGETAYFWSSSAFGPGADGTNISRSYCFLNVQAIYDQKFGFGIRLVKDAE